jgi:hypothetical protein
LGKTGVRKENVGYRVEKTDFEDVSCRGGRANIQDFKPGSPRYFSSIQGIFLGIQGISLGKKEFWFVANA